MKWTFLRFGLNSAGNKDYESNIIHHSGIAFVFSSEGEDKNPVERKFAYALVHNWKLLGLAKEHCYIVV